MSCRSWATNVSVVAWSMWRAKESSKPSLCAQIPANSRALVWAETDSFTHAHKHTKTHAHTHTHTQTPDLYVISLGFFSRMFYCYWICSFRACLKNCTFLSEFEMLVYFGSIWRPETLRYAATYTYTHLTWTQAELCDPLMGHRPQTVGYLSSLKENISSQYCSQTFWVLLS